MYRTLTPMNQNVPTHSKLKGTCPGLPLIPAPLGVYCPGRSLGPPRLSTVCSESCKIQHITTSMSVLFIDGLKCTLAASHGTSWWVMVSMPMGKTEKERRREEKVRRPKTDVLPLSHATNRTDRRTDARPLHYAFRYKRGQRKNDGCYWYDTIWYGRLTCAQKLTRWPA